MRRVFIAGLFAAILLALFVAPHRASAHVLLMDTTKSVGAILHIMPDDDPIAGEESDMYFDRQGAASGEGATVSLSIRKDRGEAVDVRVATTKSLSTATYVFPAQGVYQLIFTVKDDAATYIFEQSHRVTRGVASAGSKASSPYWAEALFVITSVGMLVLLIVAFSRRKEIAKQSTF